MKNSASNKWIDRIIVILFQFIINLHLSYEVKVLQTKHHKASNYIRNKKGKCRVRV